jgi:hypothetical protein
MGRNKITMSRIQDDKERRVCFKKRRIGAVKKLMQLSKLTGCKIVLKIYHEEESSLLEYRSNKFELDLDITKPVNSYLNIQD